MQESKEQRVHGVFEKIYKNYDQMNSVISFQRHKKWRDKTMQIMNVKEGAKRLMSAAERLTDDCPRRSGRKKRRNQRTGFQQNMLSIGEKK